MDDMSGITQAGDSTTRNARSFGFAVAATDGHARSGTIGHISWLYYKGDPNRTLRLGDNDCEIMFCLTAPEYRGRGLYPSALQVILDYLKGAGFERCFICVRDDNVSSIRGIEKAGFRRVGIMKLRKFFGIQVSRRRSMRPSQREF